MNPHSPSLPYDELFFLPFDHRSSFEKDLFGIVDRNPTSIETERISKFKTIIYDGFKLALKEGVPKEKAGILVDEQFGSKILLDAKANGYWTACSVEKSGQKEFDFAYGLEFENHIIKINPDFVKVLVRFNPESNRELNRRQTERLKRLSNFCVEKNFFLMFELLVPATVEQLAKVKDVHERYEIELRPHLMVKAIEVLQSHGIEPNIWKVEGVASADDCLKIARQAQRDFRKNVKLIVLGRGQNLNATKDWLAIAARTPGFIGFAIGRTVWEPALKLHVNQQISSEEASKQIATNFKLFCDYWKDCKRINERHP